MTTPAIFHIGTIVGVVTLGKTTGVAGNSGILCAFHRIKVPHNLYFAVIYICSIIILSDINAST